MLPIPFELEQLYDGTGRHLGGIYAPLATDNVLTQAYHDAKALRQAEQILGFHYETADLALVYMLPLGMTPAWPVSGSVLARLVHAVDAGRTIVLHGDNADAVRHVGVFVAAFVGGGHA